MNSGIFSIGLIILVLGLLAFTYETIESPESLPTEGRYGQFAIPLIAAGIVVMLIGALIPSIKSKVVKKMPNDEYKIKSETMVEEA